MPCELPTTFDDSTQAISGSVTALGLAGDTLTGDINITAPLIVDATLHLFDADVNVVQIGITITRQDTLFLRNTRVSSLSGFWAGIDIEPGGVLVMDSSTICFASEAVHAQGLQTEAGVFHIADSRFDRNYLGLRAENYRAGPHPGRVHGTTFRGGALPFIGPGGVTNGSVGIWIDSVSDRNSPLSLGLLLGDTARAANRFDSLDFGVYAVNSSLFAQNNRFHDIQNINGLDAGFGIQTRATGSLRDTVDLIVGPLGLTPAGENVFTDCRFGVAAQGMDRIKISANRFAKENRPFRTGIYVSQSGGEINIGNNVIDTFSREGIWLDDNGGNNAVSIFDNVLTSHETPPTLDNTGIRVDQPVSGASLGMAVNGNRITGTQRGIVLLNVDNDFTPVRDNTIEVHWVSAGNPVAGIALFGVDSALVEGNTVRANCASVPCTNQDIYGIYTENSTRVLLRENRLDTVGYGALIAETSTAGNANCNVFTGCGAGFGFRDLGSGAIYGPVYGFWGAPDTTTVSDNAWFPAATALRTICFGATGTKGTDIFWSYRAVSSPVAPDPSMITIAGPLNDDGGAALITDPIIPDSFVTSEPWCNDTSFMLRTSGGMATGANHGRLHAELQRAVDAPLDFRYAYLYTYAHSLRRSHALADPLKATWGSDLLQDWEWAWEWNAASTAPLPAVDGRHPFTDALLSVYGILQRTPIQPEHPGAQDSIPIPCRPWDARATEDDLANLSWMADQTGRTTGPAVYVARALLNRTPLPTADPIPEPDRDAARQVFTEVSPIWPNPASQSMHALVPEDVDRMTVLRADGRTMHQAFVQPGDLVTLDVAPWPPGMYHVHWTGLKGKTESRTFIVAR